MLSVDQGDGDMHTGPGTLDWGQMLTDAGGPGVAAFFTELTVTTDHRSVLAEVVATRFGSSTASVFRGFSPQVLGVMRSAKGVIPGGRRRP